MHPSSEVDARLVDVRRQLRRCLLQCAVDRFFDFRNALIQRLRNLYIRYEDLFGDAGHQVAPPHRVILRGLSRSAVAAPTSILICSAVRSPMRMLC